MTDEQPVPIYLSPEEELTSVRERLEKTQARRIILVIPPQTQLRSHVGWRLIHARMRELGKDLLVISPDRQVRAVARAAGFRVAESQESPSSRPRLGTGSTRPGSMNTRGAARSRMSSSRGGPESRASQQQGGGRRQTPGSSNRPLTPLSSPADEHDVYEDEATLSRPSQQFAPEEIPQAAPPATLFKEPEEQKRAQRGIHISTTPSVHPSVPGHLDDEGNGEDKYYDDYNTARRIRESASGSGRSESVEQSNFPLERERESRGIASRKWGRDPFAYMEDDPQPLPLPEQKGSMPGLFDEIGTSVPDISDRSTEIMESEIEDLGDMGALIPPESSAAPKPAPREQSPRARRSSGQMRPHSPRAPRPGAPDIDDDDELLAIPDRPTQTGRPSRGFAGSSRRPSQSFRSGPAAQSSQRPSQALKPGVVPQAGQRPSQALRPGVAAQSSQRPSQALNSGVAPQAGQRPSQALRIGQPPQSSQRARSAGAGGRAPVLAQPASMGRQSPGGRQSAARRGSRGLGVFLGILILLLIVLGVLFYFVPTATVTISLQARDYSQTVKLNATVNPQAGIPGNVQATIREQDFSATGQGTASGQAKVGNAYAQGLVTFTNNGSTDVTVPTGTIVETQSGVPFATTAEAYVAKGQSQPAVPVSAQQTGIAGNVAANSITAIPSASVASIAQSNHTTAQAVTLAVTNPQATSGGGVKNEPAVRQQDLQALQQTLHQNVQQQIKAWLNAQTQPGDLHGTPIPDVLASANPLSTEQLSEVPAVGQTESSGTFSGTLSLHIKVLFASATAIKAAAGALLNTGAQKLSPSAMLAAQLPITLAAEKGTPAKDGSSLAISVKATGAIIRQLSLQDISTSMAGKSVGQAASDLRSTQSQTGIQNVVINVTPSFLGIMPQRADRIQIILQPIQQAPPNHVSNQ